MESMLETVRGMVFMDIKDIINILLLCVGWYIADKAAECLVKRLFKVAEEKIVGGDTEICNAAMVQRLKTIRQLVTQLVRVVVALFMGFWLLESFGVDVRPIIAGIGVVGLGISLAAQNVIRDFINGMLFLMEDQYNVGDWIEVNTFSGTVERITLRATRLRDFHGNLVIIPNSLIQTVVNYTKHWSVAVVKVGITYESNYGKASEIMTSLGEEMAQEAGTGILEPPTVQGITDFTANSVNMRIIIKTAPGRQWEVGRKYRVRLKELFDKEGIFFAYPQIVIHKSEPKTTSTDDNQEG